MNQTHIRPIHNDEDHSSALARIEELMDAAPGSSELAELEVLSQLVEIYESERWPIGMPSPVAAIKFRMEQSGLTRRELEPYLGSSGKVSEVLSGKQPLTLKMIRALHRHLGIPAEVLLGEPDGRLEHDGLAEDAEKYPLKEMAARGWFDGFGDVNGRSEEAIRWLYAKAGVAPERFAASCRKNDQARQNAKMNPYALRAWCLQVLARAAAIPLRTKYESSLLSDEVLRQVAMLSVLPEGPLRAKEYLAQLGIRLVIVEHLKGMHLDGAALLMEDGSPVIALTLRYDRIDSFWHCLLHELAHVKNDLTGDRSIVYDDFNIPSVGSEIERRADAEAANALVPPGILPENVDDLEDLITEDVIHFARLARVHPAIIAGRVRQDTGNWRKFARLVAKEEVKAYFA